MLAERIGEPAEARDRRRRRRDQDQRAGEPDEHLQRQADRVGEVLPQDLDDADERRAEPRRAELGSVCRRERRQADHGDRDVEDDDEADRGEEASRERATRVARFLGEVRNRLEPGVREHRERQRERDRVPGR